MTAGGRRNVWLRLTDSVGITEPGRKPEPPSLRLLVLQTVGYTVLTVIWALLAVGTSDNVVYLIAGFLSLVMAVVSIVMLFRSRRRNGVPKQPRGLLGEDSK
jgi:hypothetical protein